MSVLGGVVTAWIWSKMNEPTSAKDDSCDQLSLIPQSILDSDDITRLDYEVGQIVEREHFTSHIAHILSSSEEPELDDVLVSQLRKEFGLYAIHNTRIAAR
jgi:hypothetical protein